MNSSREALIPKVVPGMNEQWRGPTPEVLAPCLSPRRPCHRLGSAPHRVLTFRRAPLFSGHLWRGAVDGLLARRLAAAIESGLSAKCSVELVNGQLQGDSSGHNRAERE
eukprot:13221371-Alexandrium_andersonii.AAC.1